MLIHHFLKKLENKNYDLQVVTILRETKDTIDLLDVFGDNFYYQIQTVFLDISLDFRHSLTNEAAMRFRIFLTSKGYNIFLPAAKPSDAT